jgi:hypothetical protein
MTVVSVANGAITDLATPVLKQNDSPQGGTIFSKVCKIIICTYEAPTLPPAGSVSPL